MTTHMTSIRPNQMKNDLSTKYMSPEKVQENEWAMIIRDKNTDPSGEVFANSLFRRSEVMFLNLDIKNVSHHPNASRSRQKFSQNKIEQKLHSDQCQSSYISYIFFFSNDCIRSYFQTQKLQ